MDQCIFLHLNENEYVALYCSICISIAQVKLLSQKKRSIVCVYCSSQSILPHQNKRIIKFFFRICIVFEHLEYTNFSKQMCKSIVDILI